MTRVSNLLGSLAVASSAFAGGLMVSQAAPATAATFTKTATVDALTPESTAPTFTVVGDFLATDTFTINATNFVTLDTFGYNTNAAGILTAASGGDPAGSFATPPTSGAPANGVPYGALLVGNGSIGFAKLFLANVANGLGSSSPATSLSASGNVGSLFAAGIPDGTVLQFLVNDTVYRDNGGSFGATLELSNSIVAPTASVPEPFTIIGTLVGGTAAFRMKRKLKLAAK
jgi:hypothetical protein